MTWFIKNNPQNEIQVMQNHRKWYWSRIIVAALFESSFVTLFPFQSPTSIGFTFLDGIPVNIEFYAYVLVFMGCLKCENFHIWTKFLSKKLFFLFLGLEVQNTIFRLWLLWSCLCFAFPDLFSDQQLIRIICLLTQLCSVCPNLKTNHTRNMTKSKSICVHCRATW